MVSRDSGYLIGPPEGRFRSFVLSWAGDRRRHAAAASPLPPQAAAASPRRGAAGGDRCCGSWPRARGALPWGGWFTGAWRAWPRRRGVNRHRAVAQVAAVALAEE